MKIILKDKFEVIETYSNQTLIPQAGDRVYFARNRLFVAERRYIFFIKQEVVLKGNTYQRV